MGVGFRAMGLLLQHLHGKPPLLSAFSLYFLPLAAAALTGDWVVGHLQQGVAPTVFRQHLRQRQRQRRMGFGLNMDWGLCRCVFHDENIDFSAKLHHLSARRQPQYSKAHIPAEEDVDCYRVRISAFS